MFIKRYHSWFPHPFIFILMDTMIFNQLNYTSNLPAGRVMIFRSCLNDEENRNPYLPFMIDIQSM